MLNLCSAILLIRITFSEVLRKNICVNLNRGRYRMRVAITFANDSVVVGAPHCFFQLGIAANVVYNLI
jgi:hypothetical protein